MKILNNKTISIFGLQVICDSCGAELEIEKSDPIHQLFNAGYTYTCKKTEYEGKDMLLITKEYGTLITVKCASCGEVIGFYKYGNLGYANSCLLNPERYFLNDNDGYWNIVDIAKVISCIIYNKHQKYSGDWIYNCVATPDKTVVINNQKIEAYLGGRETILGSVNTGDFQISKGELEKELTQFQPNKEKCYSIMQDMPKTMYCLNVRDKYPKWIKVK